MRLLVLTIGLVAALAGCLEEPLVVPDATLAFQLSNPDLGGFYAFEHLSGTLRVALLGADAAATLDVYDPQDRRVAGIQLDGRGMRELALPEAQSGNYVLRVSANDGIIQVSSGGAIVDAFTPLGIDVQRTLLVERPRGIFPGPGSVSIGADQPLRLQQTIQLPSTPYSMAVLHGGSAEDLAVVVSGLSGPVLEAFSASGSHQPFARADVLVPVPGTLHASNLYQRDFDVRASAAHFDGALVLETRHYSRAAVHPVDVAPDAPAERYRFGAIPWAPAAFSVPPAASNILLHAEAPEHDLAADAASPRGLVVAKAAAWVTLYDPHDNKLGTYGLPAGTTAIPVDRPGSYVVVLHAGAVQIGLDAAPPDLELHELEQAALSFHEAAGSFGQYGQRNTTLEPAGVPFRLEWTTPRQSSPSSSGASEAVLARVSQNGQALAIAGVGSDTAIGFASMLLEPGSIELFVDGYGAYDRYGLVMDSGWYGLTVHSFVR